MLSICEKLLQKAAENGNNRMLLIEWGNKLTQILFEFYEEARQRVRNITKQENKN